MPDLQDQQQRIITAHTHGTLGQTLLLTGPYGGGKSLLVDTIEQQILSPEQRRKGEDVLRVDVPDKKTRVSLSQVHEAREFLSRSPLFGTYKLAVFWHADCITPEGQNALLKAIEEPSDSSFIVLVSSYGRVLPTIRSRAQMFTVQASAPREADTYDRWALYHAGIAERLRDDPAFREWYREREQEILNLSQAPLYVRSQALSEWLKETRLTEDVMFVWMALWRHLMYETLGEGMHPEGPLRRQASDPSVTDTVHMLELLWEARERLFFTQMRAELAWERAVFQIP